VTDQVPKYQPDNRAAWRKWLRANHRKSTGVWLVFLKGAERQLTYADSVEEALCFGWIDSLMRPIDGRSYMQLFTPRKPKSNWSALNKKRVASLIERKLMTAAGQAKIDLAKANGSWTRIDAVEALVVPPDVARALGAKPKAKAFFESLAPSNRKAVLYWITGVKNPEKRAERIAHTVSQALIGLRPAHYEKWLANSRKRGQS
jgi:uncharacterized protein YdeI (YjbR/CyaY-like superfamily)